MGDLFISTNEIVSEKTRDIFYSEVKRAYDFNLAFESKFTQGGVHDYTDPIILDEGWFGWSGYGNGFKFFCQIQSNSSPQSK